MGERWRFILVLVLFAFVLGAMGCGEDESTGSSPEESADGKPIYPWVTGAAREFIVPGGDNLVQSFGDEGTAAEREEASEVIHFWMKARVAEDWPTLCSYMSRDYVKYLVGDAHTVSEGKVKTCPAALAFFGDKAVGAYGNVLTGPIDSLRVKRPEDVETEWEAWAQWHGPNGNDWVVPVKRNGGVWRVASASPVERLK